MDLWRWLLVPRTGLSSFGRDGLALTLRQAVTPVCHAEPMEPFDVAIRDESIRLGQFLKLANLVETGGLAKEVIAEGQVQVNGDVDTRRGRQLRAGDVVTVAGVSARVARAEDVDDDYFDEATADDDFDPEKWRNVQF